MKILVVVACLALGVCLAEYPEDIPVNPDNYEPLFINKQQDVVIDSVGIVGKSGSDTSDHYATLFTFKEDCQMKHNYMGVLNFIRNEASHYPELRIAYDESKPRVQFYPDKETQDFNVVDKDTDLTELFKRLKDPDHPAYEFHDVSEMTSRQIVQFLKENGVRRV